MRTGIIKRLAGSVLFALIWSALAIANPATTYHVAPLIVAAWPALGERDRSTAALMSVAGLAIAAVTTFLLSVTGMLRGPSLLPWGGPVVESLVAATLGAVAGMIPAVLGRMHTTQTSR